MFVLEALPEDVHVQGPEEAQTATLAECRRRLAGDFDTAVREAELRTEIGQALMPQ